MGTFTIKKGLPSTKDSIVVWLTDTFYQYFLEKYIQAFHIETYRPKGQVLIYINQASIALLFRIARSPKDIHPNKLYKEFVDWVFEKRKITVDNCKMYVFKHESDMSDFLDQRAVKNIKEDLGTVEEFKAKEEARIKEAYEFFSKRIEKLKQKEEKEKKEA